MRVIIHYNLFISFCRLLRKIYNNGAAKKIEENDPATTPIPIVKANCCIALAPNTNIAATTRNVVNDVPIDLLIVCHTLCSIRFP